MGFFAHHGFQGPSRAARPAYAMALRNAQGQRGKYLTRELSSTRNPVEDMCAIVSKFQSAKIGVEAAPVVSFEDLDAMAVHNWPVAAPHAYPVFGRTTPEQALALPAQSDLLWMEGALGALLTYMAAHMEVEQGEVQPADLTVSASRVGGEAHVHLRLREFEAIFQEDHGV